MLHLPLFHHQVRKSFPGFIKKQGYSVDIINAAMDEVTPEMIDTAVAEVKGAKTKVKALGDGSILKNIVQAIKDFFGSPEGQAVLAALLKLVLGLLVAKGHPAVASLKPADSTGGEEAVNESADEDEPDDE